MAVLAPGAHKRDSWFYDPLVARFIQPDTVVPTSGSNPQYLNRYSYVRGNPASWNDPTGHCASEWSLEQCLAWLGGLQTDLEPEWGELTGPIIGVVSQLYEDGANHFPTITRTVHGAYVDPAGPGRGIDIKRPKKVEPPATQSSRSSGSQCFGNSGEELPHCPAGISTATAGSASDIDCNGTGRAQAQCTDPLTTQGSINDTHPPGCPLGECEGSISLWGLVRGVVACVSGGAELAPYGTAAGAGAGLATGVGISVTTTVGTAVGFGIGCALGAFGDGPPPGAPLVGS